MRCHICMFVGDTGYSKDFLTIQEKFGFMDLALIPIGAYAPRWFMKELMDETKMID